MYISLKRDLIANEFKYTVSTLNLFFLYVYVIFTFLLNLCYMFVLWIFVWDRKTIFFFY